MKKLLITGLALLLALPVVAAAQDDEDEWYPLQQGSLSFRIGYFQPAGESDLWEENVDSFTFEVEDFNNYMVGFEFNWFVNKYVTAGFGIDVYNNVESTEYRDFIGSDGGPIQQELELTVVPISGTIKLTPLGNGSPGYGGERGTPFVPWVGGGIDIVAFTYREVGEFIDFGDDSIFDAEFLTENEAALGFHVAGGIVIPVGFEWDVFGEVKYMWAEGDLSDDFIGFDPIDLGGLSFHFGASYRF